MLRTTRILRITLMVALFLLSMGQAIPASAGTLPPPPSNDALTLPPEAQALRTMQPRISGAGDPPGYYDTSVYAIGTVAVGLVLPESNGALEASTENWNTDEIAAVKSKVQEALTWWESQAPASADLHFILDSAAPRVVPTSYEPINHPQSEESMWINDTLANLGYVSGSKFERTYAYVNALRTSYHTDWAFVIYVADSSNDPDGYFSDGRYFAYSYLGGPFMVMTYDNDGWGIERMERVAAHEVGHIFMAGDQYAGSCRSTQYFGYLGVKHTWCNRGGESLMKTTALVLSVNDPARGQVGWRDSDADGVPDPIDAAPTVALPLHFQNPTVETAWQYAGTVEANAWPHATCTSGYCWDADISLTRMSSMEFQVDGGNWQVISADDGVFNEEIENFVFAVSLSGLGAHTITARGVAAFDRGGSPSTTAGSVADVVTISGPIAPGIYDDKSSDLFYTGVWSIAAKSKSYDGGFRYTAKLDSALGFLFDGTRFDLLFTTGRVYGTVDVYVDGIKIASFSQNNSKTAYQQRYSSPAFAFGTHSVRLVLASGSRMNVDAVQTYGAP